MGKGLKSLGRLRRLRSLGLDREQLTDPALRALGEAGHLHAPARRRRRRLARRG